MEEIKFTLGNNSFMYCKRYAIETSASFGNKKGRYILCLKTTTYDMSNSVNQGKIQVL